MPTYGQRPQDVVTDSRGNTLQGVTLKLYATEALAQAGGAPLETVVTDSAGRWTYTTASTGEVWARLDSGQVWQVAFAPPTTSSVLSADIIDASPTGRALLTAADAAAARAATGAAAAASGTPAAGKYVDGGTGAWTVLPSGMPAGIAAPDDFTAVDGPVINAGTATTGFFTTSGGSQTDTLNSVACVRTAISQTVGEKAGLNITSQSTTGKKFVLVDFAWAKASGMTANIADVQHLLIADSPNLTGATSRITMPYLPPSTWVTLAIPVSSLGDVESIGVVNDGGTYATGGQAVWNYWSNIRWANQTEADQAQQQGSVLISPTYAPGVAQELQQPINGLTRVNLKPSVAWIDGFGGVRNIREWGLPEDGLTECSANMARAFGAMLPGQTLVFPPNGFYWVDKPLRAPAGVRIDFNGSTLFTRVWRGGDNNVQDPMIEVTGKDVQLIRPRLIGYRENLVDGSTLSTVAGAPANSGTGKLLDAQGESVTPLTFNGRAPWYARYPLVQFPTAYRSLISATYPAFRLGNAWVFTLSDSAQVTSDCVLEAVNVVTGAVEATRTLTLTATPTEYVLAWEPGDLEAQVSVRIRKATATANTITVASMRSFGHTEYNVNHDSANAIVIQGATNVLVEGFHIEGSPTDAVDSTSASNKNVIVRDGVSRCSARQGVSCNLGSATFENILIIGANRSGVDIEPYGVDWLADGVVLRNLRIIGCENWAMALNNWAGIANLTIDGIVSERCLVGTLLGGGRGGTITDITSDGAVSISGQRLRGGNITCSTFSISDSLGVYAPTAARLAVASGSGSSSNTMAVTDASALAVGMRVYVMVTTPDPVRRITAIAGGNVTFDGDPVSWSAGNALYSPSVQYESSNNTLTGITLTSADPPAVSGVTNKISDVRGTGRRGYDSPLAQLTVSDGYRGARNAVRDGLTRQFGWSFSADRSTEPPFVYGGLFLRGQAMSGLKGISGDRRTGTFGVADVGSGGRGTSASLDLGYRGLTVQLHNSPWAVGTNPSLTVIVETSQDNANWYRVGSFADTTGTGLHDTMVVRFCERYLRARYLFTGTGSPGGGFTVTALYSVPTNNLAGTWTGASSTTATVAFPSKGGPEFSLVDTGPNAAAGSLTPSTTYYYRIGARTREAGPKSWYSSERSAVLGAGQTSATVYMEKWLNTYGRWTDGFTVLRGTTPGTYTTRFDVLPKAGVELFGLRHDFSSWIDKGTYIEPDPTYFPDFPNTYPTLSPKLTISDETGAEVDNTYKVFTMPAYTAITKRADGFDVTFAAAQTSFDWFIVR